MKRKRDPEQAGTSHAVMDDFDVFLNHRGPDVKNTFIAHLEEALRFAGFRPFLDARSLMKGNPALQSIDEALDTAKVHVAVVSKRYAESKYCLNELVAMVRSGKPVVPVFYDVEPVDLRWVEKGPFGEAFEKHKARGRTEKKLQEWRDALKALAELTGFRLADYNRNEAHLKGAVVDAVARLTPSNDPVEVEEFTVGLEGSKDKCVQALDNMGAGIGILGLLGMGGVGKTTLAREIYNHFVGERRFRHMTFLEIHRNPSSSDVQIKRVQSPSLQEQLLWDLLRVQATTSNYRSRFQQVSSLGPVLIVIDNIHKLDEFEALVPFVGELHPGSRIIITSRDRGVFKNVARRVNLEQFLFDVSPLNLQNSNVLFNRYAFGTEEAPTKYKGIAKDVVKACGGMPLALKVMGSTLFDERSNEDRETIWLEAVDALKECTKVMDVLRWSYDNLSSLEKRMFVDITCLFCNESKAKALAYWRSCRHCGSCDGIKTPQMSLRNLMDKNIIHQRYDGILRVHDLFRDLGKNIGKDLKSHLICHSMEDGVAVANQGTNHTMVLNLKRSQNKHFEAKTFAKMSNLHSLVLPHGAMIDGDLGGMSKELRMLQWTGMPFSSVPTRLNLRHILFLDFNESSDMAFLWTESTTNSEGHPNLQHLNLTMCTSITKLPDSIGQSTHLQQLYLTGCESLERLPESIGQLKALQELDLDYCTSLKALPDSIGALSKLTRLYVEGCKFLVKLPSAIGMLSSLEELSINSGSPECQVSADGNIGQAWTRLCRLSLRSCGGWGSLVDYGALKSLQVLKLGDSTLTEIPESLGLLTGLRSLYIESFDEGLQIECLPKSIADLKMLQSLTLGNCEKLKRLPKNLGALTSLKKLTIRDCPIRKLPKSLGLLSGLTYLSITACKNLQKLPASIRQLKRLWVFQFKDNGSTEAVATSLQGLLGCGSLNSVTRTIGLQDSTLAELPESLGQLRRLYQLEISCERLQCLPDSISGLTRLRVLRLSQCHNLKRLPKTLGALTNLEKLRIESCPIRKLPKSIGALSRLLRLSVNGCENLQKLPSSVRQLHSLRLLELEDCGGIETMGALATLQGLPIWGSTSITKLPAALVIVSTLVVYDTENSTPLEILRYRGDGFLYGTTEVLEEDESGYLKACRHKSSGQIHLLRGAHKGFSETAWLGIVVVTGLSPLLEHSKFQGSFSAPEVERARILMWFVSK
ncbi:hypothetical protein M758_3G088200 [Ceratodon purpureus]|nr:hypothetical protein M758_3G088200 [Ceratodon purpureus]